MSTCVMVTEPRVVIGAALIEKHSTLRRADGSVDSAFSLEPLELGALVTETERAGQALDLLDQAG